MNLFSEKRVSVESKKFRKNGKNLEKKEIGARNIKIVNHAEL